jgi:serine/threonine-protein kinase
VAVPDVDLAVLALALGRGRVRAEHLWDCGKELGPDASARARLDWLQARGFLARETQDFLRVEALGTLFPVVSEGDEAVPDPDKTWEGEAPGPEDGEGFLPDWARYRRVSFIAEGGMGKVYKAFDPRLRRWVALKFIRYGGAAQAARFIAEAQSQARVDHPNISKVFEVGEVRGRSYIAMQFVDGPTLDACAASLSLEDKVRILMRAAEGIHAAHRMGLVHRDVKPANILVERDAAGLPVPYVTDFGLARELDPSGGSLEGTAMGTPHFMAPEQVHGKGQADPRTDVWGLGATLYAVLTGRPPVSGAGMGEIFRALEQDDPVPPRRLDPALPADLETIVLKCLEKDPARRYRSAQALAEDLRRFLDGEPVLAVPPSWIYRSRKVFLKHRTLGAVAAAGLLAVAGMGGWAVRGRLKAAERTRMAQAFSEEVDRLETGLRFCRLLPEQDVRRMQTQGLGRLAGLEEAADQAGVREDGAIRYALGRGHMALSNLDRSRVELERAWDQGVRGAGLARSLGLCLARIYARDLPQLDRIALPAERESRRLELERSCRDRARSLLAQLPAGGGDGDTLLARAHLAHLNGDAGEAFRLLEALARIEPWRTEARVLEARIHLGEGSLILAAGKQEAALARFGQAEQVLARALAIAKSDPDVHETRALVGMLQLEAELQLGRDRPGTFQTALAAARAALAADPERATAFELSSRIQGRWAEWLLNHGGAWEEVLRSAEADGRRALALEPSPDHRVALASLLSKRGQGSFRTGRDPRPAWEEAADLLRRAGEGDPKRVEAVAALAGVALSQARWDHDHGLDGSAHLEEALAAGERVLRAQPGSYEAWYGQALARIHAAGRLLDEDQDPSAAAAEAERVLGRALEINPRRAAAHASFGSLDRIRAEWALRRGQDPGPHLRNALAHATRSIEINPAFPNALILRGECELLRARSGGGEEALQAAEAAFKAAMRLNPRLMVAHLGLGTAALRRAELPGRRSLLPTAEAALREAHAIRGDHWEPCLRLAEAALLRSGPGPEARRWGSEAKARNGRSREVRAFEARLSGPAARP